MDRETSSRDSSSISEIYNSILKNSNPVCMFYFAHPFGISTPSTNKSNKPNNKKKYTTTTYLVTEIQKNLNDEVDVEDDSNVENHENLHPWPKSMLVHGKKMPNIEAFLRELKLDKINAKISEAWKTPKSRRSRNTNLSDISSPEQTIYRMQSFNSLDNYNRRLTRQRSLPELIMRRYNLAHQKSGSITPKTIRSDCSTLSNSFSKSISDDKKSNKVQQTKGKVEKNEKQKSLEKHSESSLDSKNFNEKQRRKSCSKSIKSVKSKNSTTSVSSIESQCEFEPYHDIEKNESNDSQKSFKSFNQNMANLNIGEANYSESLKTNNKDEIENTERIKESNEKNLKKEVIKLENVSESDDDNNKTQFDYKSLRDKTLPEPKRNWLISKLLIDNLNDTTGFVNENQISANANNMCSVNRNLNNNKLNYNIIQENYSEDTDPSFNKCNDNKGSGAKCFETKGNEAFKIVEKKSSGLHKENLGTLVNIGSYDDMIPRLSAFPKSLSMEVDFQTDEDCEIDNSYSDDEFELDSLDDFTVRIKKNTDGQQINQGNHICNTSHNLKSEAYFVDDQGRPHAIQFLHMDMPESLRQKLILRQKRRKMKRQSEIDMQHWRMDNYKENIKDLPDEFSNSFPVTEPIPIKMDFKKLQSESKFSKTSGTLRPKTRSENETSKLKAKKLRNEIGMLESYKIDAKGNIQINSKAESASSKNRNMQNEFRKSANSRSRPTSERKRTKFVKLKQNSRGNGERFFEQTTINTKRNVSNSNSMDSGPIRKMWKTEIKEGDKHIEILEIIECENSTPQKNFDMQNMRSNDSRSDSKFFNHRNFSSRIPVPVYRPRSRHSPLSTTSSTSNDSNSKLISSSSKVDRMIADLLLDALQSPENHNINFVKSPKLIKANKRTRNKALSPKSMNHVYESSGYGSSGGKYFQRFEVIPEEKSNYSYESSSNEERKNPKEVEFDEEPEKTCSPVKTELFEENLNEDYVTLNQNLKTLESNSIKNQKPIEEKYSKEIIHELRRNEEIAIDMFIKDSLEPMENENSPNVFHHDSKSDNVNIISLMEDTDRNENEDDINSEMNYMEEPCSLEQLKQTPTDKSNNQSYPIHFHYHLFQMNNFVENPSSTNNTPKTVPTFNDYWTSCSNSLFSSQPQTVPKTDTNSTSNTNELRDDKSVEQIPSAKDDNVKKEEDQKSNKEFECNCIEKTLPWNYCNEKSGNIWQAYEITECNKKIIQTKIEHFETNDEIKEVTTEALKSHNEKNETHFKHSPSIFDKDQFVCHNFRLTGTQTTQTTNRTSPIPTPINTSKSVFCSFCNADMNNKLNMECNFCKTPQRKSEDEAITLNPVARKINEHKSFKPNIKASPKKLLINRPRESSNRKRVKSVKKEVKNEIKRNFPLTIETIKSKRTDSTKTILPRVEKSNISSKVLDQHSDESDLESSSLNSSSSSSSSKHTILQKVPIESAIKCNKPKSSIQNQANKDEKLKTTTEIDEISDDKKILKKSKELAGWKVSVHLLSQNPNRLSNQEQPDLNLSLSFPKNKKSKENTTSNRNYFTKNNELVHVSNSFENDGFCLNSSAPKPTFSATSMRNRTLPRGISTTLGHPVVRRSEAKRNVRKFSLDTMTSEMKDSLSVVGSEMKKILKPPVLKQTEKDLKRHHNCFKTMNI